MSSILRVLAYNPQQVIDGTYSTVGTVTWSSVEQGLGIVCACLPTFGPLFVACLPNRTTKRSKGDSGIGIATFRSGTGAHTGPVQTDRIWKNDESTVGFAQLQDNEGFSPSMGTQRDKSPRIGVAISSEGNRKEENGSSADHLGITKEQTISQRSDIVE